MSSLQCYTLECCWFYILFQNDYENRVQLSFSCIQIYRYCNKWWCWIWMKMSFWWKIYEFIPLTIVHKKNENSVKNTLALSCKIWKLGHCDRIIPIEKDFSLFCSIPPFNISLSQHALSRNSFKICISCLNANTKSNHVVWTHTHTYTLNVAFNIFQCKTIYYHIIFCVEYKIE